MISATLRLSRVATAIAALLAATATGATAGMGDPDVKPGVVVKIAPTNKRAADDKSSNWIRVQQLSTGGSMAKGGEFEEILVESWGWSSATPGAAKNMALKGSTIGQNSGGDPDRPVIVGQVPNAAGRRQHRPVTITKEWDASTPQLAKPPAKGSVWVKVATPWAACRVGARYPSLQLGGGGKSYVLRDVTVASCGRARAGDDRPTEEVAFYYNRIAFNYASSPGN